MIPALLALAVPAAAIVWRGLPLSWREVAFAGCWVSVVLTAASVHLPRGLTSLAAIILALNVGVWSGAVIALAGTPFDLAEALPWALIGVPGAWVVATGRKIALKVAASWLIAIALLVAMIPVTTPTPGYVPDHMD